MRAIAESLSLSIVCRYALKTEGACDVLECIVSVGEESGSDVKEAVVGSEEA